MRVAQWARLQTPARCGLRWGAWYPVMGLTAREAKLWVRGRSLAVTRSLLELRSTPPREWTVARTKDASDPYLVCRLLLEKKRQDDRPQQPPTGTRRTALRGGGSSDPRAGRRA